MNEIIEEKSITEETEKWLSIAKKSQSRTLSNGDIIYDDSVATGKSLLGLKITKVKFRNQEYYLKANRYLLLIILKYLIENNKINLNKELPLKNHPANERCLLNDRPFHADNNQMSNILIVRTDTQKFYIESKLDTNTIHNACYSLLSSYKIPIESLEVQYSKKRRRVAYKYLNKLKKQGYCLVYDSSISGDLDANEICNDFIIEQNESDVNCDGADFFDLSDEDAEFKDDSRDFFDLD